MKTKYGIKALTFFGTPRKSNTGRIADIAKAKIFRLNF
jgi:hypothetical protein